MTVYWAIAVGINQYQHFQPLIYAAHDAQALQNCLVGEVGFAPAQSIVLTDTSLDGKPDTTTPDRYTIQNAVAQVCQQVQPGDVLWFFFSGYGVQFQGRDYLMPIDGDPNQVSTTGIAVESLFSMLQSARTDNVFVLLDINRSQGIIAGLGAGADTTRLAQDYGMATILSCPPEQFSHETLALRLGLFTTAVIEGLRNQRCVTLEHLGQFLRDRLPELSEHHWRPRQDPVVIIPDGQRYQLIVPGKAIAFNARSNASGNPADSRGWSNSSELSGGSDLNQRTSVPFPISIPPRQPNGEVTPSQPASPAELPTQYPVQAGFMQASSPTAGSTNISSTNISSTNTGSLNTCLKNTGLKQSSAPVSSTAPAVQSPSPSTDLVEERSWRRLLQLGGTVLAVLLTAVFIRNIDVVTRVPEPPPDTAPPAGTGAIASPTPVLPDPNPPATDSVPAPPPQPPVGEVPPVPVDVPVGQSIAPSEGQGSDRPTVPETGFNPAVSSLIVSPAPTGNTTENPAVSPPNSPPAKPLEPASTNPISNFFSNLFKSDAPGSTNSTQRPSGNQPPEPAAISNPGADGEILNAARAALSQARGASATNQVTEIAQAIRMARQIRPDQPAYPQAQADIDRWSAMILDMAKGRAVQRNGGDSLLAARNYTQAIAAARLVPSDRPQLFGAAQQNITEWSQKMLELANINAGLNDLYLAVQVAQQIPQDTAAYPQAQQAIANWQTQLSQAVGLGNEGGLSTLPT